MSRFTPDQELGWSGEVIRQFIADRFEGKRWSALAEDERLLLLYHLRGLGSLDAGETVDIGASPTTLS
jgi:hypothetical protein